MLLLIDAGNTRLKWALTEDGPDAAALGAWIASGSAPRAGLEQLAAAWQGRALSAVLVSNVAGPAMRGALQRLLAGVAGSARISWFQSAPRLAGISNGYRQPTQLGCDRFASAIGAHALFPGVALIIATCGTATTVDAVSADGWFAGGMILPGLELMAAALASNTAQLPRVRQESAAITPFADNTDDAIVSGCIAAQTGAIEHALAAHARRHGEVKCIMSGGAAASVAPHLSTPYTSVDNLVLIGLQVATRCKQPC